MVPAQLGIYFISFVRVFLFSERSVHKIRPSNVRRSTILKQDTLLFKIQMNRIGALIVRNTSETITEID